MISAEERLRTEWDRTAELLANQTNLKAGKVVVTAKDLNRYRKEQQPAQLPTVNDMTFFLDP